MQPQSKFFAACMRQSCFNGIHGHVAIPVFLKSASSYIVAGVTALSQKQAVPFFRQASTSPEQLALISTANHSSLYNTDFYTLLITTFSGKLHKYMCTIQVISSHIEWLSSGIIENTQPSRGLHIHLACAGCAPAQVHIFLHAPS